MSRIDLLKQVADEWYNKQQVHEEKSVVADTSLAALQHIMLHDAHTVDATSVLPTQVQQYVAHKSA